MHHRLSRLVLAAATAVALAGCGSSASSGNGGAGTEDGGTEQVKVGVIPIVDVAPVYLGEKKGFFEERGIELTLESGQGGAAIVPGVVSGQFQFGFSNVTSLMVAHSKGVPIQSVANGVASTGKDGADFGGVAVAKDSKITSAKDLAGKKVAVNTLKNIGDTTVRESVRKAGGDPENIKFTELPFDQMPAALSEGRVEAAWLVEPALSIAKSQGARVVASNFVDAAPDLTVATYFTSAKTAQENPELVKKFTEAVNESLRYADEHPDEVRDILGSYTKIDPKLAKSMTLPRWPAEINRDSIEKLAELGRADGVFSKTPDLDALFR
ncbi:ABC transporter substrate-binding protein [Streptomyces sp. F63]|uniref:ABC transporter substrate-binding protein n=1 Tax=Streptomyces sp. F63 TaxID=2824887 RepID=UPI001B38A6CE|nr:ABC transporter substrate-binding protein [Streptomyces sp. F63]MBQ0986104.1 ABC transporter substrate-binding protein [Streptomyces sp. F63]